MTILTFDIAEINRVIKPEIMAASSVFYPTTEQVFDGANYPGGQVLNAEGKTKAQIGEENHFYPDPSKMKVIPKALVLTNDKGFYLHANVKADLSPIRRGAAVWANGFNPARDEDWENKTNRLYRQPLTMTIAIKELVTAIKNQQTHLHIDIVSRLAGGQAA